MPKRALPKSLMVPKGPPTAKKTSRQTHVAKPTKLWAIATNGRLDLALTLG
ncbi:hypothetical protein EV645_0159 [Kribbella rubisoli]|uniref:Uncharacterized protein n=1 Tax=Kribbella rubisoli TaxID=3075929 RepID=A0A4Q7XL91_9ACTN|nr:hypothetical protein EV645_0159 [Kribbella rubisoli]